MAGLALTCSVAWGCGSGAASSADQGAAGQAGASGNPDGSGPLSCRGLPATCGATSDANCCASVLVPGGAFNRFNDVMYPATVSDFSLDTYEITVGRFRKFVEVYAPSMTSAGAGKNPNNPSDPGWDPSWNAKLPADRAALLEAIDCSQPYATWHGLNANRPMNCLSWYEANAFCIWDGGRLPTLAEWNYAAVGGNEQRPFAWGPNAPEANATLAVIGSYYRGAIGANETDLQVIAPVGSIPAGNGKWGHSDLIGNVAEWALDSANDFPVPCADCAGLKADLNRSQNGGHFNSVEGYNLSLAKHSNYTATLHDDYHGARCVRSPTLP
ncbi:MAG TPA: SUMF1/EgtB/PvdO family nonheme iron enzyme [Polyangiaceae bacterium]|nr:SUMF1/EgtB/PvdO family nonheme iron enzyme [Polyangiaceae bacterium]